MENQKLFKNQNIGCNLDFNEVKEELLKLFKSPNPFHFYLNSQNVKDKFSQMLSCLTLKVKEGFAIDATDEKTFIMSIYKQTNYDKVWLEISEKYLRDIKNFDLLSYLHFVKILNKDKQYLSKALLKMYLKYPESEIRKFLMKFNAKISYGDVKVIFDRFDIENMKFSINLREDFVEHFIEKIYLQLDEEKRSIFLDNFILKIDKSRTDFNDITKVTLKLISSYVSDEKYIEINKTITSEFFSDVKLCVDDLIERYFVVRSTFYIQMNDIIGVLNQTDRIIFWQYVKRKMIDLYYPEVKNIFYDQSSNTFLDKNTFSLLSADFKKTESISPESQYLNDEYKQIDDLREIILELSDNLFSFFLLPVVYHTIGEKIALRKKDLYKMKYLLLFIFSQNYAEYKKIYMFFNQLEVFLNYDNNPRTFEKVQVGFSIILFVFLVLLLSYFYLPIGVFLGVFVISIIRYFEIVYPNIFYKQKWNIGIKFFATVFLTLSTYYWITNFDKVKKDTVDLGNQIQMLGTIPSRDVIDGTFYYLKTNLFETNINHKKE